MGHLLGAFKRGVRAIGFYYSHSLTSLVSLTIFASGIQAYLGTIPLWRGHESVSDCCVLWEVECSGTTRWFHCLYYIHIYFSIHITTSLFCLPLL